MYKCIKCGKSIEFEIIREKIRCPYCGYRVVSKERPKTLTRVPAK